MLFSTNASRALVKDTHVSCESIRTRVGAMRGELYATVAAVLHRTRGVGLSRSNRRHAQYRTPHLARDFRALPPPMLGLEATRRRVGRYRRHHRDQYPGVLRSVVWRTRDRRGVKPHQYSAGRGRDRLHSRSWRGEGVAHRHRVRARGARGAPQMQGASTRHRHRRCQRAVSRTTRHTRIRRLARGRRSQFCLGVTAR